MGVISLVRRTSAAERVTDRHGGRAVQAEKSGTKAEWSIVAGWEFGGCESKRNCSI